MANSLVTLVLEQFAPGIIEKLTAAIGERPDSTRKAIGGLAPALLAGLAGVASTPSGADRLVAAARSQNPGLLDNLAGIIGGSDRAAVSDQGTSMLTSLLGGQAVGGLTSGIAKYSDINPSSAAGLIGMCAPIVMGVLRRRQSETRVNAGGLARMLLDQKESIAAALPSGLGDLLGGSGILDSISDRIGTATSAAGAAGPTITDAGRSATQTAARAMQVGPARAGIPAWAYVLGGLVLVGLLGYWLWGMQGERQTAQQAGEVVSGSSTPRPLIVGQVDVGKQVAGAIEIATKSLEDVTDAASAKAALPPLKEAVLQLDQATGLAGQLPPQGKRALKDLVATGAPTLQQLIDKTAAIPGAADVLKPTLDALKAKLAAISTEA